jgi:hypothetical protein
MQELSSPRQSTVAAGGGLFLLLIFAAFLRGKRSGQYVEEYAEDDFSDEEMDNSEPESDVAPIEEEDWDDDIEMLD